MESSDPYNLQRFLDAQDPIFETALGELEDGSKRSHWMWFIFPQLAGLGQSPTARYYGIASAEEARAYVEHPILGNRVKRCVEALLTWSGRGTAEQILGPVDALKLCSSLTLFDRVEPHSLFAQALHSFCGGITDQRTLALLAAPR